MKLRTGNLMLKDFRANADAEGHPYVLAHVSREENKVEVMYGEADLLFVLAVVAELLRAFQDEHIPASTLLTQQIWEN